METRYVPVSFAPRFIRLTKQEPDEPESSVQIQMPKEFRNPNPRINDQAPMTNSDELGRV